MTATRTARQAAALAARYLLNVVTTADYLSVVRIPLGLVFLAVAGRPGLALGVLAVAGLTDVLDGWVARRQRAPHDTSPHRGDWLDPLCDKLFAGCVVLGLWLAYRPPASLLALLLTRELLQTVSVIVMRLVPALHRGMRDYNFKAHPIGKATTVLQFVAAAALAARHASAPYLVVLVALLGTVSVGIYINRVRALPGLTASARPAGR